MELQTVRRRQIAQINTVPYIDVMLVLMLIFMVATPLMQQGVQIELPKAASVPVEAPPFREPLVLEVGRSLQLRLVRAGSLSVGLTEAELAQEVERNLNVHDDGVLYIRADAGLPYGEVVALMARLEQGEVATLGLLTEPIAERRP